jgi:hypothetical protein
VARAPGIRRPADVSTSPRSQVRDDPVVPALIAFSLAVADLLTGTAIPVVIISYMLKFTKACSERVTHAEASAAATP